MRRGLMALCVFGLVCAGVANASVQQGDTEFEFLGSWFDVNADGGNPDAEVLFLSASLGYFFTDNIQVSGFALGAWTEFLNVDRDIYGFGVRAKYHFMPMNQWVPYVGAQLAWANVEVDAPGTFQDSDTDAVLWGPLAGLRFELNATNDFFIEYQYHLWESDIASSSNSIGLEDGHAIFLGIIHQFK